jgi:hypothetical protein
MKPIHTVYMLTVVNMVTVCMPDFISGKFYVNRVFTM